jgi:hypothetical protein
LEAAGRCILTVYSKGYFPSHLFENIVKVEQSLCGKIRVKFEGKSRK